MKVKRLIEELQKYDPNATVIFASSVLDRWKVLSIYPDNDVNVKKSKTKFVYVDVGWKRRSPE
jgi:hypothetical protein